MIALLETVFAFRKFENEGLLILFFGSGNCRLWKKYSQIVDDFW